MSEGTIFALSSAPGRAGVAVVRVSGPEAKVALARLSPPVPRPRHAAFRTLRDPVTGEAIDRALVLYFAAPDSETGEDVAEFQVHGGRAVVRATLAAIGAIGGCRLAEPGEFARRAFEAGKIDLAEAEGLADLVEAETDAQRRQAMNAVMGETSRRYEGWRVQLVEALALVEAAIDFSDEADVASTAVVQARAIAAGLEAEIEAHLDDQHRGEILRDGFRVALLGPPNAGKSSLLNALARREAAIVSEEAGTTRDVIEVRLDLAGYPVIVSDTAGLREAQSAIEREGIRRSLDAARCANLVIWLADVGDLATAIPEGAIPDATPVVAVTSKADLAPPGAFAGFAVSSTTGFGIDGLIREIGDRAAAMMGDGHVPAVAHLRHRMLLEKCGAALATFRQGSDAEVELRAEDLRGAAFALGRITGRVDVEDVLDQIFGRFCIGK